MTIGTESHRARLTFNNFIWDINNSKHHLYCVNTSILSEVNGNYFLLLDDDSNGESNSPGKYYYKTI